MHYRLTLGVRPPLEGKQRTRLSSRVATGISWSPLSGLKGVKPPLQFGESTRDCSQGPHLEMTATSRGFSRAVEPVLGFSRGTMGSSGSLSYGNREVRSPWAGQGGGRHCFRVRVGGIGPQDGLKKDTRGLSRVVAGNPGFPLLVPVTSGSFSGCL